MKTQVSQALRFTIIFVFAAFTSGIIPLTAHASSPHDSDVSRHSQGNAYAYGHTKSAEKEHSASPETVTAPTSERDFAMAPTPATQSAAQHISPTPALHNPSGNNGTIKINEETVPDSIPNNDPHVSCRLNVAFYNYDYASQNHATVSFTLQNPTASGRTIAVSGNQKPFIGHDAAGGGRDLDAFESYRLSFSGAPHDRQGYHVKVTIHADGSRGNDVKHKVFWVEPCTAPAENGHVLGVQTNRPAPTPATLPATLPSTGTNGFNFMGIVLLSCLAYLLTFRLQKFQPEHA
jgi:hypothetical protein